MKVDRSLWGWTAVASILLFTAGGCAHQSARVSAGPTPVSTGANDYSAVPPVGVEAAEPSVRGEIIQSIPELKTVRFDYDSSFLKPQAEETLVNNAQWLKNHQDARVQVAGNCDQRGTVEYNLGLGQRRAKSVRDYYVHLGISGSRIATISYGKERPLCRETNEACWQKNRRAETLRVASRSVAAASVH